MRGSLIMAQSSVTENLCGQCRICLDVKSNQISVFKNDLSVKIERIADVEISPGDGLPTSICLDCAELLNQCYELREQVIYADKSLREGLSFSKVDVKEFTVKEENSVLFANDEAMDDETYDSSSDRENDDNEGETTASGGQESETPVDPLSHVEVMDVERTERTMMPYDPLGIEEPLIETGEACEPAVDPLRCMKDEPLNMESDSGAGPSTSTTTVRRRGTTLPFSDLMDKNNSPKLKIRQPEYLLREPTSTKGSLKSKTKDLPNKAPIFQKSSSVIPEETSTGIPSSGNTSKDTAGLQSVHLETEKVSAGFSCSENSSDTSDSAFKPPVESNNINTSHTSRTFCIVCNIDLEMEELLREHREMENGNFMCRVCTRSYEVHSKLEVHFFTHKSYKCPECKLKFFSRRDLLNHRSTSACNVKVSCDLCSRSFYKIENLRSHKRTMHSEALCYIACIVCLKTFKTVRQRSEHLKNCHIAYESLECSFCHRLYIGPEKLKSHLKLAHVECNVQKVDPCKCPFCDKVFTKKSNLRGHVLIHDKTIALCELCGKSIEGKMPLYYHMREEHSQKGSFSCEICGELFDTEKRLKRHSYRRHTERSFTPSMCEICGKSFKSGNSFRHHMQTHSEERPYRCDICGADFKLLAALRTHGRVHNNIGKYSCNYCTLTFKWKQTFDKHLLKCEASGH